MRSVKNKSALIRSGLAASVLLLASAAALAQSVVNLTARSTVTVLPDGSGVPMWGLFCNDAGTSASCATLKAPSTATPALLSTSWTAGAAFTLGTVAQDGTNVAVVTTAGYASSTATAAPTFNAAPGGTTTDGGVVWTTFGTVPQYQASYSATWAPPIITVPVNAAAGAATTLTINLTNSLSFTPATAGAGPNNIPTSLVIVGQLGGGLGVRTASCDSTSIATSGATCTPSPDHTNAQPVTWPVAGDLPGAPVTAAGTPPVQGPRLQSFSTEVAAGAAGTTTATALTWSNLKPGTYLIESGTHPSIQGPMGLYGILVVTTAPVTGASPVAGTAYPGVTYNADMPLLFSEIDPVQNAAVQAAVGTAGFSETKVWSGLYGGCGNPLNANGTANSTYQTCYPPAVNYSPLYYLINGRAFDKTNTSASLFAAAPATGVTGTVLVRLVNAGLRMHVPSIVGSLTNQTVNATTSTLSGFSLIAEDGNVLPGVPRVQSEVFMPAGKTNDVMINVPTAATALPIFDRELSLSGNAIARDAGMLAYISVNGVGLPSFAASASSAAQANPDTYNSVIAGRTLTVSDPAKGVLANDVNISGVQVFGPPPAGLTLNSDGTFTYSGGVAGTTFTYCGNGIVPAALPNAACALVTLGAAPVEAGSGITMSGISYNANGTFVKIQPPGILSVDKDTAGYPLTVAPLTVTPSAGLTLSVDPNGGFSASIASTSCVAPATTCPYTFTYKAQNSQGTVSANSATVTVNFAPPSGLSVTVLDGKDVLASKTNPAITPTVITDYRWIIEEDRTFYVNPNCSTNPPPAGCPGATTAGLGTTGIVPTFGTNFHTSYMPLIAAGCTGQLSCEGGQTIFDNDPTSTTFGQHVPAVCDVGNGICRPDTTVALNQGFARHAPGEVNLDPSKRYYLTVFPGDAGNPFHTGNLTADCTNGVAAATNPGACGHGMGGVPIPASVSCITTAGVTTCTALNYTGTTAPSCTPVAPATSCVPFGTVVPGVTAPLTALTQPDPYPPSKLSVFVFEDDFPLNGEHDGGGGIDVLSPNEPGLGGFNITLFDDAGGTGDATGQMTYDMFNQPLVNALAGTIDPATNLDACPVSKISRIGANDPTQTGITGTIVTCPKYESDGRTLSPLAGQAVVANLMPGRYGVVATPGADHIARGEEWLQTNTLDGQKAHDSFLRIGEPSFFQEFGPAGYHVSIGFANPAIINARKAGVCGATDPNVSGNCNPGNTVTGLVTTERMSRTPDQRLYSSGDNSSFAFTQCYVSLGDADGEDFAFTKCNAEGTFTLTGIPDGDWRITVFDQWNDMLVDGLSTPVRLGATGNANLCPGAGSTQHSCNMGEIAMNQWQANIYTRTFFDTTGTGLSTDLTGAACAVANPPAACNAKPGLTLVPTNIRFRDGSYSNFNNTDLAGSAGFNEVFPLFSWYVIETDSTRYKNTGTHVVYDAGGPSDGTTGCGGTAAGAPAPCGNSNIAAKMANTFETVSVPTALQVPGAVYCTTADCTGFSITTPGTSAAPSNCTIGATNGRTTCTGTPRSTGRIDPPWVRSEGWQGFSGQNSFIEFGKAPFQAGENGGIHGEVIYASTRPFDDPQLLLHTSWTPDVPGVTINLYQVGTAPDGSQSLTLVDTTKTSSWDDWAQGFYPGTNKPYMNCPGQLGAPTTAAGGDLFFFTMFNQPMWLDAYNNGGTPAHTVPNNSQFKCYDGMHNWNQVQPAPYDGMYQFPSIAGREPTTGKPIGGTNPNVVGTNCTICVANPVDGTPMLPNGQYVVEMIVPPGYELVKEEDKNILIGDNYIAPVTQEFPGLGSAIYILPDQASVAAVYNANQGALSGFNASNAQNPTQAFGRVSSLPSHEGDTGSVESFWPCVGATRIVPDFISLFPQSLEVAPFAGAKRNLCDRKLVQLDDQTSALAKFWVFTSAHVAAHFTGVITDDFTSEFDPFSPQFGEKFSPANLPVAVKDWTGQEISRVYADQWGTYDGLTYSTWEVNPPNPTGYAPTMMVTCMNDPGTGPTPDPLYNPAYSQFCYEIPFMPGQTQYMDTPVVPTSAFAGAGYNNPDCDYPDATPAVSEVDGTGVGPWVSGPGQPIQIYALGDVPVNNYGYNGPSATKAPFNAKTVVRHYGFGTGATVTIGGVAANCSGDDLHMTCTVPAGVPDCVIQQQAQYGGSAAQCGQLVITAANGKQSVDAVTVTIGGKPPTHVAPTASVQAAIDAASPGDMLMIDPATQAGPTTAAAPAVHQELLLMWKPVRLQGVGAVASVINANTHPAGKIDVWRRQVNCLFGLTIDGVATTYGTGSNYDSTGTYACGPSANFGAGPTTLAFFQPSATNPQIDRLPLEAVVGWNASLNGNLAEMLQEPSLMGALEGAAITVLSKGVNMPDNATDIFGANAATAGSYPAGTILLTNDTSGTVRTGFSNTSGCGPNTSTAHNPFPSNFYCNPSSIDGLTVENSSQGGGGVFVHGWGHNLQIANNRITNNTGTLSGGINVGQGEFAGALTVGGLNADPGTCQDITNLPAGAQEQYCYDVRVNMHHNAVTKNSSTGDELFSATPAGGGGVSICNGSDFYKFNYNWVCGNLSTGDGGGVAHIGFSYNGDIEHNSILFNQSTNPTIATNGGGLLLMGAPDVDPPCGTTTDADCVPSNLTTIGPSDGVGPELMVNANLVLGNAAESGSGGGIALQNVNGSDVLAFPNTPSQWHHVTLQNNIIVNNVAGWDGGGVSLLDALNTDIINNTIASNVSTASSGVLFNTLGAPLASTQGPHCTAGCGTFSAPQPAGLVSQHNSAVLEANILALPAIPPIPGQPGSGVPAGTVTCPVDHGNGGTAGGLRNGHCKFYSYPLLANDLLWHNRSYRIGVGALGAGALNQQNVVALYDPSFAGGAQTPNQQSTGACTTDTNFWDLGVRGDTGPTNHSGSSGAGGALAPTYSVISNLDGYGGPGNTSANPNFVSLYCDGSRIPPESGASGWHVPPGIADATVPNPRFHLTPAATVDEGNNWINIAWGPLSLSNPALVTVNANGTVQGNGTILGNYALASGSPAIDHVPASSPHPLTDFFGNPRPDATGNFDVGAIETPGAGTSVTPTVTSVTPPSGRPGTTVAVIINGTNLSAATNPVTVSGTGVTAAPITSASPTAVTTSFTITSTAAAGPRNVTVTAGTPPVAVTCTGCFTVAPATLTSITPNHGVRGNTGATGVVVNLVGTGLTGATGLSGLTGGVTLAPGSFVVNSSTSITATLNISGTATLGARNVAVTFPTGPATNTVPFYVGPFLTGIAPSSGVRGTSVAVTITGVGLTGASAVTVTGGNGNVTATINPGGSDTQVNATLNIASAANTGNRAVSVTTLAGASNTVTFAVQGATVTISAPSPALNTGGTGTKNGTITVSNAATASAPLTLTGAPSIVQTVPTSPPAAMKFSITGGTCVSGTVVNPGSSCTINVQYAPGGVTTTATAHVSLPNSGATTNPLNGGNFNGN